jgi:hypothetical protein
VENLEIKTATMMIFIAIFLGQVTGVIIFWARDYLVRFSISGNESGLNPNSPLKPPVVWSLLVSSSFRQRLTHRDLDAWLPVFVEVFLSLLFAFLWQRLRFSFPFFFLAIICSFLVLIALIDLKYRLVLNVF